MKKLQHITIMLITMLISTKNAQAQLPSNDSAWIIQTSLSDEFNGSSVDLTKWDTTWNYWQAGTNVFNGAEWAFGRNDSVKNGYLTIWADTLSPNKKAAWTTFPDCGYGTRDSSLTYAYQGGVVISKDTSYGFGYIETYAKFPSKKWPLWVGPWINKIGTYHGTNFYNEIDIAENNGPTTYSANLVGNNWYANDDNDSCCIGPDQVQHGGYRVAVLPSTDSLSGAFHKFAVQWDPHRFIYYFDDKPTTSNYDATGEYIPQHPMHFFLQFCIDPWSAYLPANWNGVKQFGSPPVHGNKKPTLWPQRFVVDYVHYYKLKTDCSNTGLVICTPTDYDRKVKQSIKIGGSCSPNYNPSDWNHSYTLRATDFVEFDAGSGSNTITINPSGTGYFAIDIIACPQ